MRNGPDHLAVLDERLEVRTFGPAPDTAPTVVFLHEGLGCVSLWRDVPERLAGALGCGALVYSRAGYGASSPRPGPWPAEFMHREALTVLPRVLAARGIDRPVLFGHSDGGSIALLFAAAFPDVPRALVLEAPHVFVEEKCVRRIARLAVEADASGLTRGLARHHGTNAAPLLAAWTGVWLAPEFRRWDITAELGRVRCPTLVIQGEDDEYGTALQVEAIARGVAGPVETALLPGCGHAPHADRAADVLRRAVAFLGPLLGS